MNGFESEGNGYVFPNKVPKGMTQKFVAVVADKGQYDVKNTEEPFQCKWTATLAGVGAIKTETIEGDPATRRQSRHSTRPPRRPHTGCQA